MSARDDSRPPEELLNAVMEAIAFAAGEPVSPAELGSAIGGASADEVETILERLERRYREQRSGLRIERVAGGVQLATHSEVGPWVRRFFRQRNRTRISPAALETLAIVAYRQPVTAPEIQAIRGKDPAYGLRTLLEKKLIRILGKKKVVGSPLLYGTSRQFLIHFGLDRLKDLPAIDQFEEFVDGLDAFEVVEDELEPEGSDDGEHDEEVREIAANAAAEAHGDAH